MTDKPINIRGVDAGTYQRARAAAIRAGVNIGVWITAAIKEKLSRKKGGEK